MHGSAVAEESAEGGEDVVILGDGGAGPFGVGRVDRAVELVDDLDLTAVDPAVGI